MSRKWIDSRPEPAGVSFETNASGYSPCDVIVASNASGVMGKLGAIVLPTTYALPRESTAIACASSFPSQSVPPRYVEYSRVEPSGLSFATNASPSPLL